MDDRPFNRGAMKNIGFMVVKSKYPTMYHKITLVFNDVDTYPVDSSAITSYKTIRGIVRHFYGYTYALGGIVAINASDFERVNGFPNYWAWGFEDNLLLTRLLEHGINVDRTTFYPAGDTHIHQMNGTYQRTVNVDEFRRYVQKVPEGISSISSLKYLFDPNSNFVNVSSFMTEYTPQPQLDTLYDTSRGNSPFTVGYSGRRRSTMNMIM